jgi:hypothetical protein
MKRELDRGVPANVKKTQKRGDRSTGKIYQKNSEGNENRCIMCVVFVRDS